MAFIKTLIKLAEKDKRIYLLTGDVGFSVVEEFIKKFPERFFNCGLAEQNMVGVAAGLALSGKKPYIYTIIPFVILRCLEHIRNNIAYQNLDVKIVLTGAGFTYGHLGITHYAIEDLGAMRSLPNFTILCPADPIEAEKLTFESYKTKNPTYIRLSKAGEKIIHKKNVKIEIGKPIVLNEGKDGTIISSGIFVSTGKEIVEKLKEKGYNFKLISLPTLKPIDEQSLFEEIKETKLIFSLEEHNVIGGLGSALAEILMKKNWKGRLKTIGIDDFYPQETGEAEYLREKYIFKKEKLIKEILKNIKK
jgi:transketolase